MKKQSKDDLIKLKKKTEKKLQSIEEKIKELEKPAPIGFNYKNRII